MPFYVRLLKGTAAPGVGWDKIAELYVPSNETWKTQEIRIIATHDDILVRLYARVGTMLDLLVDTQTIVSNKFLLPLPCNVELPGGAALVLEANNLTNSAQNVYIELIYAK